MWYRVKGNRETDNGAAAGSRAVLTIAVLIFIAAMAQAVMTVMADAELSMMLVETSTPQDIP